MRNRKLPAPFRSRRASAVALAAWAAVAALGPSRTADARVLGLDISAWQGDWSQSQWDTVADPSTGLKKGFAFIRSSRGGTTGFYNQNDASNLQRNNVLGQRYDDPLWETNVLRATSAGLLAGPYHFARGDVFTNGNYALKNLVPAQGTVTADTAWFNIGDRATTGADEAQHFLQAAGAWMKPGYLLPTMDLEAGDRQRSTPELSAYSVEFANTILAAKGVRPLVYINQNYALNEIDATVAAAMPNNWIARWNGQGTAGYSYLDVDPHNDHPEPVPASANLYGPWNPQHPVVPDPRPWKFWQYTSKGRVTGYGGDVDLNAVNGDIEVLREYLVPALWTKSTATSSRLWTDVRNWNSDLDPSGKGPAARLPGAIDTIVLDSASFGGSITLNAGSHTIRKLLVREALDITGGSLTANFVPRSDLNHYTSASVEVDGPLTVSGSGALGAHTIQVNASRTLAANGGSVTFAKVFLGRHATTPGKLAIGGNVTFAPLNGAAALVASASGVGLSGTIDLTGGGRTITVTDGPAAVDLQADVPVVNGTLTKAGAGTLALTAAANLSGALTVDNGTLLLGGANGAATGASGYAIGAGGRLELDNSVSSNGNRVASAPVTLNGGTLGFVANATTETAGDLAAAQGASTVALSGSGASTLSFGAFSRAAGATVNFTGATATLKANFASGAAPGSFISQGTFTNGADYAVYDAGAFVRPMATGAGANDCATTLSPGRHVKLSTNATMAVSSAYNTLNLAGAVGVSMGAATTMTLNNGGVIKSGGGGSTIGGTGAAITTAAASEYVFNTVAVSDQLTVAAVITGGSGLTKTGAGALMLGGGNTYAGATTVNQGTLRLGASNAIPDASHVIVGSGAELNLNGFSDTIGNLTLLDGSVTGSFTITLNGASPTVAYAGTGAGSGAGGLIINSGLALGSAAGTATFNIADGAAPNDLTVAAIVQDGTGAHGVTKTGAGTLAFASGNAFSGPLSVAQGTLAVSAINATATAAQPLGTSAAAISLGSAAAGGTLAYNGSVAATLNRQISAGGAGGATIRATSGALTLGAGGATSGVNGNGHPITFDAAGGDITVNSAISGDGTTLTKIGAGTLTLTASNGYTGQTHINRGTLALGGTATVGLVTFDGGTLRTTLNSTASHGWTVNAGGGTIETAGGNTFSYSGGISGAGPLVKTGTGTFILAAPASHTGPMLINGGFLSLTSSTAAGSTIVVNSGGTLLLANTGTVNGSATITTGGAITSAAGGQIVGTLGATGGTWNGAGTVGGAVNVTSYGASFTLAAGSDLTAPAGVNVSGGTLAGSGTLTGNATLSNAGAIDLSGAGNITGALNVTGGSWIGTGTVGGLTQVSSSGTLTVNGTLGGAGALTLGAATTLAGSGTIDKAVTVQSNARVAAIPSAGPLTINGAVSWNGTNAHVYSGTVNTQGDTVVSGGSLLVTGTLGGTGALQVNGTLAGTGTVAKPVNLNGTINFGSFVDLDTVPDSTYTGKIASTLNVTNGDWTGSGSVTGLVTVAGSLRLGANTHLKADGGVLVNGAMIALGGATSTVTGSVTHAGNGSVNWSGVIAGDGNTLTINNQFGTLSVSGVNTYTGQTTVSDGILALANLNAVSASSGIVTTMNGTHGGTVRLAVNNGIYNHPLTIGGAGVHTSNIHTVGDAGALYMTAGAATWAGTITLNGTQHNAGDPLLNQIGAATGGVMTITGVIQNGAGSSWGKTDFGDVVLAGATPNTYTGLTRVLRGRLIVEKDGALGAAGSSTATGGNTFMLAGSSSTLAFRAPASSPAGFSYNTYEWINLDGFGGSGGQIDNLGGANTFTGMIGLAGAGVSGGGQQSTLGVSAGSLELSGGIYTRGASGVRVIDKLGPGLLVISGNSNPAPSNTVNNGSLANSTFNVTAGTVELRAPSQTSTNLPGVTAWNVAPGGTLRVASGLLATGTLSVADGGAAELVAHGPAETVRVATLELNASGRLNVGDGKVIVDYAGASPIGSWIDGAYTGLTAKVKSGRNGGAWDGHGIVTSMSDASPATRLTGVGIAEASQVLDLAAGETSLWRGHVVDATSVLIAYTYAGDTNLDGKLDGDDYFRIDSHVNAPGAGGWASGDFDYNGRVDGDDYFILDSTIGRQAAPLVASAGIADASLAPSAGTTAVPEPTGAAAAILITASSLLTRRRRRAPAR
ncbi:MAG TPA: autotransporter-associated beta strand repeat-containing protein [Tepidisphaeraceae bacterium]|nr:autotransporter-associated beta strand repeat-containing protein [Tepidisphaeraceae bacterium]